MRVCCSALSVPLGVLVLLPVMAIAGKSKAIDAGHAENAAVSITATPYMDKDLIKQVLGSDLGGLYTVLEVTVTPKSGKLTVDPDDFMLRTDKDGERTHPMAPNQVAGGADMVLHGMRTPTVGTQNNGMVWGGAPTPKGEDESGKKAPAAKANTVIKPDEGLVEMLRQKVLAYKETEQPVTGFLIFDLEKQKAKDLELVYTSPAGPLRMRFR